MCVERPLYILVGEKVSIDICLQMCVLILTYYTVGAYIFITAYGYSMCILIQ